MIDELKPYEEYKESGLPWLGRVPKHWEVRRLRASVTDCVNGVWGNEPDGRSDLICIRVADFDRVNNRVSLKKKTIRSIPHTARNRRCLKKGDLLLEKSGGGDLQPVGVVVLYDHLEQAVCSNFVARMPLADGYNAHFVNYLHSALYAKRINVYSVKQTTGIQNLDSKSYLSELVAYPPPDEQAAIVKFLDYANGKIERAIRAKRKLIGLLNEQKQAIIHRAVTRGLDPNVKLKPSGIPWLGDVPEHWEVMPLRKLVTAGRRITYGIVQPGDPDKSGRFMVRGKDYSFGWASPDTIFRVSPQIENPYTRSRLSPGDIVMTIVGAGVGNVAVVPEWLDGANITQTTARVAINSAIAIPHFVELVLKGPVGKRNLERYVYGSAQPRMNLPHVGAFEIPVPTIGEQLAIVRSLDDDINRMQTAIARTDREITLLREYRTTLTAEVVTGKLDVREAAKRLPDQAVELLPADESLDDLVDDEIAEEVEA